MRVILDTNIAIDIMARREPFIDDAAKVFTFCCSGLVTGYFTSSTFTDLYYILKKYLHDELEVRNALDSWIHFIRILDVDSVDCKKALVSDVRDLEDALVAEVGKRHGIEYIVTRNTADFRSSPVPAVSPADFVKIAMKYKL